MIYYFTGTGNSKWVAETMAAKLGDEVSTIAEAKAADGDKIGIVAPTYAWGCPGPVGEFLKTLKTDGKYVFFVATCGSNCGMYDKQVAKLLGRPVDAFLTLSLPNNCIQLGDCEAEDAAKAKFAAAKPILDSFIAKVEKGEKVNDVIRGPVPHLLTYVVHPAYLKFATSDKPFSVDIGKCNSCGACEKYCPVGNIKLVDGHPTWNGNCAQCTACINRCQNEAIQYGKKSAMRRRYHFTEDLV